MLDRLDDLLMSMGLKILFRNSGWDLELQVYALMIVYAVDLDSIWKETDIL